jgi:hypothetical protein
MRWPPKSLEDRQLLEDAIRAIEEDTNPKPLISLHALVDERLAKDLRAVKDKEKRVQLCRELMKKNAADDFYQAAGRRQLAALLGEPAPDKAPDTRPAAKAPEAKMMNIPLEEVAARAAGKDAEAAKAAMDALGTSPDPKATEILMTLATDPTNRRVQDAAITACLRRVITGRIPAGKKMEFLKKLSALDERGRNAKTLLSELPWSPSVDALGLARSYLDRKGLSEPAAMAVVAVAERLDPKHRVTAIDALRAALVVTKNEDTTERVKALITRLGG